MRLQLLRVFCLEDYPAFTRPIDPSLYLHRFVDRLKFGNKTRVCARVHLCVCVCMHVCVCFGAALALSEVPASL